MPSLSAVPPPDGDARPVTCSWHNPVAPGHALLWLTPALAVCAGGGHRGVVWEHVYDAGARQHRLKYHHNPLAYLLAQRVVELEKRRLEFEEWFEARDVEAGFPP